MSFLPVLQILFFAAQAACAQNQNNTAATTLQPVFAPPFDATSTVYATTATSQSGLDCQGSSLVVSTFSGVVAADATTNTATVTSPATTSISYSCLPTTVTSSFSFSEPPLSISPPSALPTPPVDPAAQILVDELRTAILYAELIGNDGNLAKLCSTINSAALFNETGINGTAVQNEVCSAAAIAKYLPGIAQAVILENQTGVSFLQAALFAVQVISRNKGMLSLKSPPSPFIVSFIRTPLKSLAATSIGRAKPHTIVCRGHAEDHINMRVEYAATYFQYLIKCFIANPRKWVVLQYLLLVMCALSPRFFLSLLSAYVLEAMLIISPKSVECLYVVSQPRGRVSDDHQQQGKASLAIMGQVFSVLRGCWNLARLILADIWQASEYAVIEVTTPYMKIIEEEQEQKRQLERQEAEALEREWQVLDQQAIDRRKRRQTGAQQEKLHPWDVQQQDVAAQEKLQNLDKREIKEAEGTGPLTSLNEPNEILVDITEQIICEFLFLDTRHLGHIYDCDVLNPGAKQTIKALWYISLPVVLVVPGSFRYMAAGCAIASVIIYTHGRSYYKKVKQVVTNPLAMIRYPGVFPYPVKSTLVPEFRSGPMSNSIMYSLRLSTPFSLGGRIRYYGPITVLRSSCRSTRGHFTCEFVIIHSTNIRRRYNRAKPKKVQRLITWRPRRLITWYDPIPTVKQSQSINTTSTLATHGQ
ncbi:MAG: hypothetical protein Q9198_005691, partial [Flavoplaca austrocitrina]